MSDQVGLGTASDQPWHIGSRWARGGDQRIVGNLTLTVDWIAPHRWKVWIMPIGRRDAPSVDLGVYRSTKAARAAADQWLVDHPGGEGIPETTPAHWRRTEARTVRAGRQVRSACHCGFVTEWLPAAAAELAVEHGQAHLADQDAAP